MNWKTAFRNTSVLLLIVIITACSQATATPTAAPASTQAPAVTEAPASTEAPTGTEAPVTSGGGMPVAGAGQCANAYYPVREGATWSYSSTGGPTGGYSFTDTITSVRDDGFTLTTKFDDLTRTQEWDCTPEGLVALQLGGTSVATLNTANMKVDFNVTHVSGVTFPSEINDGDTWQHALEFTAKMNVANQAMDATGDAQSSFQAIGMESVTVPAGTFEAMVCALAIRDRKIPPTINLEVPDPECDLDYTPLKAREMQVDVALSNSIGLGGHNSSLVLKRV